MAGDRLTLEEARKAAAEIKRLEEAARLLPQLEAEEAARIAGERLDRLREQVREENGVLYEQYSKTLADWQTRFNTLLDSIEATRDVLGRLQSLKGALEANIGHYVNNRVRYAVQHEGADVYKDAAIIENNALVDINAPHVLTDSELLGDAHNYRRLLMFQAIMANKNEDIDHRLSGF